jgi:hypothetical protein
MLGPHRVGVDAILARNLRGDGEADYARKGAVSGKQPSLPAAVLIWRGMLKSGLGLAPSQLDILVLHSRNPAIPVAPYPREAEQQCKVAPL